MSNHGVTTAWCHRRNLLGMETSGPRFARDAVGPLRRLFLGPTRTLRWPEHAIFRYAVPPGIMALIGFAAVNINYLRDVRGMWGLYAILLSIGTVLPLAVAVRRPVVAWRIAYPMLFLGTIGASQTDSWPWSPAQIIFFLLVMVAVAAAEDTALTVWATGFNVVVPFLYSDLGNAIGQMLLFSAVALGGDLVFRRRQSKRALAEQTELTELERARRAVLEERTRIAREMHDVVAHHMSMIAVQAETAPYRVEGLTEPARTELAGIATSARAALTDMRRLLGVLRADEQQALTAPQPGLDELPALIEKAQTSGLNLSVEITDLTAVPEPVALAAYRIIQEALANAARHAPGGQVRLEARAAEDRLDVVVRNGIGEDGPPSGAIGGHGLMGMRERAELLGGTLHAAPDGAGGFRVEASLPYGGEAAQ
jgi:signal transduction histidine kinase